MKTLKNSRLEQIYRDDNGVLFECLTDDKFSADAKAIVYIDGIQLDNYHINGAKLSPLYKHNVLGLELDVKTSAIKNLSSNATADKKFGHDMDWYDQNHKPYIFKYIVDQDYDGVEEFSTSLKEALCKLKKEVILIGKSYGASIATYAKNHSDVSRVIAVNPSFMGSPLSDPDKMNGVSLNPFVNLVSHDRKDEDDMETSAYLVNEEKSKIFCMNLCVHLAKLLSGVILEPDKQFTMENANGILEKISASKLTIVGGTIKNVIDRRTLDFLMKVGYEAIYHLTDKENDGIAIWDTYKYRDFGAEVIPMARPYHSNIYNEDYMKEVCTRTLSMK